MFGGRWMRLVASLLVALPLVASAGGQQASGESERPAFSEADANGDGAVTISEATDAGAPKSEAEQEDLDNDGELSKADWKFVEFTSDEEQQASAGQS